jgi:soluble lytic murein transglycosylase-like protein
MALYGASDRQSGAFANGSDECLTLRQGRASDGESFSSAAGRSLIVCTALAAGVAGLIVTLGAQWDDARQADARTLAAVSMPKPRLSPAPVISRAEIEELAAEWRAIAGWKVAAPNTLMSDVLAPDADAPDVVARPTGDPDEVLQFGPMRIRRHLVETIVKAAQATQSDPVLLMAIADKESSFSTGVRARTSSATGLYQFIDATWLRVVNDFGARHGLRKEAAAIGWSDDELVVSDASERARILDLRREPYISALLAAEMLKRDAERIGRRIGRALTPAETYLAHFLGPDDAERFMEKVVGEPESIAADLLPKPARANKPIFFASVGRKQKGRSIAEVYQKFQAMMDLRLDRYRDVVLRVGASAIVAAGPRPEGQPLTD